jgi:hypothetical protein
MTLSSRHDHKPPESSPQSGKVRAVKLQRIHSHGSRFGRWVVLALCSLVLASGVLAHYFGNRPELSATPTSDWIPIVAAVLAAGGIIQLTNRPWLLRIQRAMYWCGFLLMVWAANGLIFDLIRMTPFMPSAGVDWAGLATRSLALAAVVFLARLILARPAASASNRAGTWYGYAAFILALPYPVLRLCWAFGGTIGLMFPGAAGSGFAPLLIAIPWMLAAALSLFLVSTPGWMPRWLLLAAGWSATAIVAMIGPAACWSVVSQLITGSLHGPEGMKIWVPCILYSSWLLWAIAAGAATRAYQWRSAGQIDIPDEANNLCKL